MDVQESSNEAENSPSLWHDQVWRNRVSSDMSPKRKFKDEASVCELNLGAKNICMTPANEEKFLADLFEMFPLLNELTTLAEVKEMSERDLFPWWLYQECSVEETLQGIYFKVKEELKKKEKEEAFLEGHRSSKRKLDQVNNHSPSPKKSRSSALSFESLDEEAPMVLDLNADETWQNRVSSEASPKRKFQDEAFVSDLNLGGGAEHNVVTASNEKKLLQELLAMFPGLEQETDLEELLEMSQREIFQWWLYQDCSVEETLQGIYCKVKAELLKSQSA